MRWAVLGYLVLTSPASAFGGELLAADQLPPEVTSRIREDFKSEPLHARKEVEGGKACYIVTARHKGEVIEIYASPDGNALLRKTEDFSLARWRKQLAGCALFILLPAVVVGAVARGVVRAARGQPLSVPAGWLSAWAVTGAVIALVVFTLAPVPRHKNVLVQQGVFCVLWAAIAASAIEAIGLAVQSRQPARQRRRWAIGCGVVAAVSLALTIPLNMLQVERENLHLKQVALRPSAG